MTPEEQEKMDGSPARVRDLPGKLTRKQAARLREITKARGLHKVACSAFQLVDGADAGRWCGMGCLLEGNTLAECIFTTEPVHYPDQTRATQGAARLMAFVIAGREDVIEEEVDDGQVEER